MLSCTDNVGSDAAETDNDSSLTSDRGAQELNKHPEIEAEEKVESLISIIASQNRAYGPSVGITGEYTKSFASFERLNEIASTSELFDLLKHDSAAVKVYAFWCLNLRDSALADSARVILRKDTSTVSCLSGCTQIT